jgi:ribonuclease VapC
MIIVDSSAVVAMIFGESTAKKLAERLAADRPRIMSVASYVEVGTVLAGRTREDRMAAVDELDEFLSEVGIELAPVDEAQARLALRARIRHGRGMGHGGALNFGDSFAYALAKANNAPLLYVGDDFASTDVVSALTKTQS